MKNENFSSSFAEGRLDFFEKAFAIEAAVPYNKTKGERIKMHINCLIVEDERELAKAVCEYFELFDVSCKWVETAGECQAFLRENQADVLILDINLGQESGFSLCKQIRAESELPILFVSARQSDEDVLLALNIGGDDYVKKPYSLSVLLAKVRIMMRRIAPGVQGGTEAGQGVSQEKPQAGETGKSGNRIDRSEGRLGENTEGGTGDRPECEDGSGDSILLLDEGTLRAAVNGRWVQLRAREFRLLQCLYDHRGAIVTKEKLFEEVWGDSFFGDGTLNVHIRKLREKLEENPNEPRYIKTVWGTGYILELPERQGC